MIEHVIEEHDDVMQSNIMPFRHPQGPVSVWPPNFHDILDDGPFIRCCEEWLVISEFWIFTLLAGEFS